MIIYVENEKIVAYCQTDAMSKEQIQEALKNNSSGIYLDGEINIPDLNKRYEMFYRNDEIIYEEIIEPPYEPTEEEVLQAEILLNQIQIIAKQQEQDEVLAELLLNQMEAMASV